MYFFASHANQCEPPHLPSPARQLRMALGRKPHDMPVICKQLLDGRHFLLQVGARPKHVPTATCTCTLHHSFILLDLALLYVKCLSVETLHNTTGISSSKSIHNHDLSPATLQGDENCWPPRWCRRPAPRAPGRRQHHGADVVVIMAL